jgi:hypothetical protein
MVDACRARPPGIAVRTQGDSGTVAYLGGWQDQPMPRRIVIEISDDAPERLYAELAAAVSTVAHAIGNAASPSFRVEVHHAHLGQDPIVSRPDSSVPHSVPYPPGDFLVVLRGYDRTQVDDWVGRVQRSAPPHSTPRFKVALRGYDRAQVDQWVRHVAAIR